MRAIVVHGIEIPESLIAQEAQNHPGASIAASRKAAGFALATKALLLRRAAELGLVAEPELDETGREETLEAALVRAVLEAEIDVVSPTDVECRRVYDGQRAKFRSAALYEAAHILIEPKSDTEADIALARTVADDVLASLAEGRRTFADLARDHSDCPSAATAGSLGQLGHGDLVAEVEQALLALAPGQVADTPVRSRFGWHILKLERRIEGRELPFEIAAERIRLQLESRAWSAAATRYVVALADETQGQGVVATLDEEGSVRDGSGCLGDFLGDGEAAEKLLPWLAATNPDVFRYLLEESKDSGVKAAKLARAAIAEFVNRADDEQWTTLISASRNGADPAQAAFATIMKTRFSGAHQAGAQQGCSGCH